MRLINLTPHEIVVLVDGGEVRVPPEPVSARCVATRKVVSEIEVAGVKIPVTTVELGEIENLPASEDGVVYIVSLLCAQRAQKDGRVADILIPDDTVRDDKGRIIGCRALARQA